MSAEKPLISVILPVYNAKRYLAEAINSILAQMKDNLLRTCMAQRWLAICRNSAHLGMNCHRIYREILPKFNIITPDNAWRLRLRCALRLRSGSGAYALRDCEEIRHGNSFFAVNQDTEPRVDICG